MSSNKENSVTGNENHCSSQSDVGDAGNSAPFTPLRADDRKLPAVTPDAPGINGIKRPASSELDSGGQRKASRRNLSDSLALEGAAVATTDTSSHAQTAQAPSCPKLLVLGWCFDRCAGERCHCIKAKYSGSCSSCGEPIQKGQCISGHPDRHGYVHTRCEIDEVRENCAALYRSFTQIEAASAPKLLTEGGTHHEENESHDTTMASRSIVPYLEDFEKRQQQQQESSQASFGLTEEQKAILRHRPQPGELIRIKARAGTGKTTTVAFLCHELMERNPGQTILYVVFGKNASMGARQEGKFPKDMAILTSHAFAKKCLHLGPKVPVVGNYNKKHVTDFLKLDSWVRRTFDPFQSLKEFHQRCRIIAGYIADTLNRFQQSDDRCILLRHVTAKARNIDTSGKLICWKSKVTPGQYVDWARQYFSCVRRFCEEYPDVGKPPPQNVDITHDAYFKVFQLNMLQVPFGKQYDTIIVDEAQDMTACQASVLWRHVRRVISRTTVYMVGDPRQQLYRFRGASKDFELVNATTEFELTGSFRFGENIADLATMVLQHDGHSVNRVQGLAKHKGEIRKREEFQRGVVICRTNNGIYRYLEESQPTRWALFSENTVSPPMSYLKELNRLRDFKLDMIHSFVFDGETFTSFGDLKVFCEETAQSNMINKISMVEKYLDDNIDIDELFHGFNKSFVSNWRKHSPNIEDFDGIVLITCHKAKGLEFKNVLVYDDFRFEDIQELTRKQILALGYIREMIDLVYVAFTRAKEQLYLCEGGWKYMEWLKESKTDGVLPLETDPTSIATATGNAMPVSLAELREDMEIVWADFVSGNGMIVGISEIPWPNGPELNPFCLEPNMTRDEQLNLSRLALLRYHPDKFFQNFGRRMELCEADTELLKRRLNAVVDQAASIRKDLREAEVE